MILGDEASLHDAAAAGGLRESSRLDLKRELPGGDRGSTSIAIDLASFALTGGTILVGVDEGPPATLTPIVLRGVRERIEQIARSTVDPPLRVTVREIVSDADGAAGYLIIEVPPSPEAPHAVSGAFRGRAGTTNVILTANEVRRLHAQQPEVAIRPIGDLLREFVAADPTQEDQRQHAHLFIVARPLRAADEMLQVAVGDRWEAWTQDHVTNARDLSQGFSPDFPEAHGLYRTPTGWIATHFERVHKPPEPLRENYGIEVEFAEDGTIRVFCSRASDFWKGARVVLEVIVGGLARRVVDLAAAVTADTGFVGDWEIALKITNLGDCISHFGMKGWMVDAEDLPPYPDDSYERGWRGSAADLEASAAIVSRLVGPLNRVLNNDKCPMPE